MVISLGSFKLRTESWFFLNGIAFVSCDMLWDKSFWFIFFKTHCVCVCVFVNNSCQLFVEFFQWGCSTEMVLWSVENPKDSLNCDSIVCINIWYLSSLKNEIYVKLLLGHAILLVEVTLPHPKRKKKKRKLALPWVNLYSKRSSQLEL